MQEKKMAIIDLGSNSARLVIEELRSNRTYDEIYRVKEDTDFHKEWGRN